MSWADLTRAYRALCDSEPGSDAEWLEAHLLPHVLRAVTDLGEWLISSGKLGRKPSHAEQVEIDLPNGKKLQVMKGTQVIDGWWRILRKEYSTSNMANTDSVINFLIGSCARSSSLRCPTTRSVPHWGR